MVKDIKLNGKVIGKKYGVVIPLGTKGDTDDSHIDNPSVIYDGTTYKMWYAGHDGTHNRIHYATSDDGIVWDKHGVVVDIGVVGESDDYYTHTPSVIYDGTTYKMWYTGHDGSNFRIHYTTSEDGITWTKHGVVIPLGSDDESDVVQTYTPSVIYDGSTYKMWYGGFDGSNDRIRFDTSTDGITWTKYGVVVLLDANGESDGTYIDTPNVILDGATYKMWYGVNDGINSIHYAISTDGITWTKCGVVVPLGVKGDSDDLYTYAPNVIYDGSTYKMWYGGFDGTHNRIHYAELTELDLLK